MIGQNKLCESAEIKVRVIFGGRHKGLRNISIDTFTFTELAQCDSHASIARVTSNACIDIKSDICRVSRTPG
jgi:hypothetical protein